MIESILFIFSFGAIPILYGRFWRLSSSAVFEEFEPESRYQELFRTVQTNSPKLLIASGVINTALGLIDMLNPDFPEVLPVASIFASLAILNSGYFLNSRMIIDNPDLPKPTDRYAYLTNVGGTAVALLVVFGWAAWQVSLNTLPPSPFVYSSEEETFGVLSGEYCPGDPLEVFFAGTSDGSGRQINVWGTLYSVSEGGRLSEVDTYSFEVLEREPTEEAFFPMIIFEEYFLPLDLEAGTYAWKHESSSGGTVDFKDKFSQVSFFITGEFQVADCSGISDG